MSKSGLGVVDFVRLGLADVARRATAVANREADATAGGVLEVLNLRFRQGGAEYFVSLTCKAERDVSAKPATSAGDCGRGEWQPACLVVG